ncbi:hypothetical protein CH294_07565 [Rhodococcus sp. 14-2483-1-1]|uniref:toll/interleukin-1 receptor domain-containing protein n=1 Tax=Rhodococcus sp. 14-2483-1-1 TaxID=2023148 RepID=UPI000B9BF541|nr:toll/interleukin-1 receptor domain-containing protein [Rhodococcus sp. 14-2483-1-1]OZF39318.1 hypothetical protein CH294_07565 [Rhodococcus sp. 14-2483-1-1]
MSLVDERPETGVEKYKAFISYSRSASKDLATSLQTGLERFAKPWYRLRAMRVFRDDASMSANTQLWSTIEDALRQADWFVILASPEAAESVWVNKEINWWRSNRDADRILIVQAKGEVVWDYQVNDFSSRLSTAVPGALYGAYAEEPRWIDMRWFSETPDIAPSDPRFDERLADIAATVRGVDRDRLVGENVRLHRRALLLARVSIAVLISLLLVAVVAGVVAIAQARNAESQLRVATSRLLSSTAQAEAATDIESARLYAVEAYRLHADDQSRAALLGTASSSPLLVGNFHADDRITVTGGSSDGLKLTAGTASGQVLVWDTTTRSRSSLADIGTTVSAIAMSENGKVVAASSPETTQIWKDGVELKFERPEMDTSIYQVALAVSPTGNFTAMSITEDDPTGSSFYGRAQVYIIDNANGYIVHSGNFPQPTVAITMADDYTVSAWLGIEETGNLETRTTEDFHLVSSSYGASGRPRYLQGDLSRDGSTLVLPDASSGRFPIFRASDASVGEFGLLSGGEATLRSEAIALSPNGSLLAVSNAGQISVSTVADDSGASTEEAVLIGNPPVIWGTLRFLSDRRLISASGQSVSLWDLDRDGGIVRSHNAIATSACTACGPVKLGVSPNGEFSVTDDDLSGLVSTKTATGDAFIVPRDDYSTVYRFLGWKNDDEYFVLNVRDRRIGIVPAASSVPKVEWNADYVDIDESSSVPISFHYNAQNDQLSFYYRGTVYRLNGGNGEYVSKQDLSLENVTFSADGSKVVGNIDSSDWKLHDLASGESQELALGDGVVTSYEGLEFDHGLLRALHTNGDVEIWNEDASQVLSAIPSNAGIGNWVAVAPGAEYIAHYEANGSVSVQSLDGTIIKNLELPKNSDSKPQISFSGDGRMLLVLASTFDNPEYPDGALVSLNLDPENWIRAACEPSGRSLTDREWTEVTGTDRPDAFVC